MTIFTALCVHFSGKNIKFEARTRRKKKLFFIFVHFYMRWSKCSQKSACKCWKKNYFQTFFHAPIFYWGRNVLKIWICPCFTNSIKKSYLQLQSTWSFVPSWTRKFTLIFNFKGTTLRTIKKKFTKGIDNISCLLRLLCLFSHLMPQ